MNIKRFLFLALCWLPCVALGAELLEKHVQVPITQANAAGGEYEIFFSSSKDVYIKSYAISALGPPLQPGQYGFAYLWRDVDHSAHFLMVNDKTAIAVSNKDFGQDYIKIPAGYYLCLMWQFFGPSPNIVLFADITYVLAP